MGKIIYKPHCASCGALINEEVVYRSHEIRYANGYLYHKSGFIDIEPNRCTRCGEIFEIIEVPIPQESEG